MIPIYIPYLTNYKKSALDAINSGWISNHGKYIELATNKLKEITGVKHAILMSNGTVATHCLFISLKYMHPNVNKIYVPNNVYVAVYNCALMEYNFENLEILKINEDTWNMEEDEKYLLSLEKDSAVVIVHNIGGIIDVDRIKSIRPDLVLLEDNCEGIFGKYNGKYTGSSSSVLCSSVSFYGNKTITSGEGGAFITNNDDVYNHIKSVYTQGMSDQRFIHNVHAYNYRMTNIQAGFLFDQLNDVDAILNLKRKIFKNYEDLLSEEINKKKITLQKIHPNCERANWMFAIKINDNLMSIGEMENYFKENGIETRPFFYPFHSHNHLLKILNFDNENENDNVSKMLNNRIIMFPSYPELKHDEQIYIVSKLKQLLRIN